MYEKILEFLISTGYVGIIIAGLSEALFMPFPMEVIYIPVALANPSRAINYAATLIIFSFLGSIIAYAIGKFGGQKLLYKISFIKRNFHQIQELYDKNSLFAIMTSSFTPIPYEVYTITAGIFNVDLKRFIMASILSRVIRYVPQGILINLYGDAVLSIIKRYGVLSAMILFFIIFIIRIIFVKVSKHS
jgi:membrane protein YqaA with SNARE-associated domain